jgi:SAM-dependent methyltransferase
MVNIAADGLARPLKGRANYVSDRFLDYPLFAPLRALGYDGLEAWAWENFKPAILAYARAARMAYGRPARLLEIGGGRAPLFEPQEARAEGLEITVNDIDAGELARAPAEFARAQFDVAGDAARLGALERYDLVFSHMVLEHVAGAPRAFSNMHALLAPRGVMLAFVPTLYAPPFVINRLMPEAVSSRILRMFFPDRHDGHQPKFPARYEFCFGSQSRLEPLLTDIGFEAVLVLPFWTHGYFRHIPILREVDRAIQRAARARDWRHLSTYAYIVARK